MLAHAPGARNEVPPRGRERGRDASVEDVQVTSTIERTSVSLFRNDMIERVPVVMTVALSRRTKRE